MTSPAEEVMQKIFMWKWSSQSLCAAAELGLFDHLDAEQPRSAEEVARRSGLDATLLYRLLRALASIELLAESEQRAFTLMPQGELLRTQVSGSLRYMACLEGGAEHWAIWGQVPAMLKSGRQNAFFQVHGAMAFDHARAHPDGYGQVFGKAMSSFSAIQSGWVLEAIQDWDFSAVSDWCDVAGGHGHLMCSVLKQIPHIRGTVFDLPEVVGDHAQRWAPKMNLQERCRYSAGDMFVSVPAGADIYSLKMILHDWSDDECIEILRVLRRNAKQDTRILIIEHLVASPSTPHFAKLFDMHMMCWGSGRERTEQEYVALLDHSGWSARGCHYPTSAAMGIIEAIVA